jgi:hypothetical protein
MVPLLGESPQGLFSVIVRSYIRPRTAKADSDFEAHRL